MRKLSFFGSGALRLFPFRILFVACLFLFGFSFCAISVPILAWIVLLFTVESCPQNRAMATVAYFAICISTCSTVSTRPTVAWLLKAFVRNAIIFWRGSTMFMRRTFKAFLIIASGFRCGSTMCIRSTFWALKRVTFFSGFRLSLTLFSTMLCFYFWYSYVGSISTSTWLTAFTYFPFVPNTVNFNHSKQFPQVFIDTGSKFSNGLWNQQIKTWQATFKTWLWTCCCTCSRGCRSRSQYFGWFHHCSPTISFWFHFFR